MYTHTKLIPSPKHSVRSGLMASCFAVLGLAGPAHAGDVIVTFDPDASTSTWVSGINDKGAVTGYYLELIAGVAPQRGFVREADGTIKTFAPAGSRATFAESIDADGAIAGYYTDAATGLEHGFVRAGGVMPDSNAITAFDALYLPGAVSTYAWSISNGDIAGSYTLDGSTFHGFVRHADGGVERFDAQGATSTYALSIKNGYVTGYYSDGTLDHCFIRVPGGTIVPFDPPASLNARCYAIDASRWVTGYYTHGAGGGTIGFTRSSNGAFASFDGNKAAVNTYAFGINERKAVTGSWQEENGVFHGFERTAGGKMQVFDPAKSTSTHATSINDNGSIAGYWKDSYGQSHGFVRVAAKTPAQPSGPAGGVDPVVIYKHPVAAAVKPPTDADNIPHGVIMKVDPLVPKVDNIRPRSYSDGTENRPSASALRPKTDLVRPKYKTDAKGVAPSASNQGVVRDAIRPRSYSDGTENRPSASALRPKTDLVRPKYKTDAKGAPSASSQGVVKDPIRPRSHSDGKTNRPSVSAFRPKIDLVSPKKKTDARDAVPSASKGKGPSASVVRTIIDVVRPKNQPDKSGDVPSAASQRVIKDPIRPQSHSDSKGNPPSASHTSLVRDPILPTPYSDRTLPSKAVVRTVIDPVRPGTQK